MEDEDGGSQTGAPSDTDSQHNDDIAIQYHDEDNEEVATFI